MQRSAHLTGHGEKEVMAAAARRPTLLSVNQINDSEAAEVDRDHQNEKMKRMNEKSG